MATVIKAEKRGGAVGSWIALYRDGAKKQREKTFESKAAAQDFLADVRKASRQFAPESADSDITVSTYSERWLAQVKASSKPRTHENYAASLRVHILPQWGEVKVREIHRAAVKSWALGLSESGKARGTVSLLVSTLGTLLSSAVDDAIILANPCAGLLRSLKLGKQDSGKVEQIKAFTSEERTAVLDAIKAGNPKSFPLFLFLADTGCRIGEALAIRWEDLALGVKPKVRISRTLSRGRLGSCKGGTARTVDLSAELVEVLRAHEVSQKAETLKRGWPGVPESIFTTSTGKPVPESDVRRVLARALAVAGVARHHTPHSFRHTFASLLLSAGESIQYVQQALGHSDIKLTVNVYGRWLPAQAIRGGVNGLSGRSRENGGKVVGEAFPLRPNVVELFPAVNG